MPTPTNLHSEIKRLQLALQVAGIGTWSYEPTTQEIVCNDLAQSLLGYSGEGRISFLQFLACIHPEDHHQIIQRFHFTPNTPTASAFEVQFRTKDAFQWRRMKGKILTLENSFELTGIIEEMAPHQPSQKLAELAFQNQEVGFCIVNLKSNAIEYSPSYAWLMTGNAAAQLSRFAFVQYFHPEDELLRQAAYSTLMETGQVYFEPRVVWDDGSIHRIRARCAYDTERKPDYFKLIITSYKEAPVSHGSADLYPRFQTLITASPIAMGLVSGEDMTLEIANEALFKLLQKGRELIGKSCLESLTDWAEHDFIQDLRRVHQRKEAYTSAELPVNEPSDSIAKRYYQFHYTPVATGTGHTTTLIVAVDVTDVVVQRQNAIEAQATLMGAVELAQLGTWELDLKTDEIIFSDRMRQWYGFDSEKVITLEAFFESVRKSDVPRLKEALAGAFLLQSIYDVEYTLENVHTHTERILHAQGKIFYDAKNEPYKVSGTAQDVTKQRKLQFALESQIQARTEELAVANGELIHTNEKLARTIDELAELNLHLMRSNESLEQFAYIASHDLQEPLRKIQQFGDLLKKKFQPTAKDELLYLNRMQDAAKRMSLLIHDLLNFSKISSRTITLIPVCLNEVFQQIRDNLSIVIEESGAQVQQAPLPSVQGDASQLRQLFQNLLSNALKFSSRDTLGNATIPNIQIRYQITKVTDLPLTVKPIVQTPLYHQIDIQDNGIGFDEQYLDRIFQVFQRLHGKNEFAGTGVGLAICLNVVNNHGGAITAYSVVGKGSIFTVYFPA
ncbi:ATP-binding protein [Siphonobacter sp. SORGH_AS_0500]|uniref:PAS domain-containing sensor histidine kinase n=1 Tax=Siphonobacter sp. SORGH_AS_0500 TaxID=1864824 RepID=UPI00285E9429|nr:ATP-binding protein [Siphonobacter sp. SORGH_AS_0500]MDR6194954.1 signal transduction histidine kinase [Siphonobacter sp. SORGH_AS_0500]